MSSRRRLLPWLSLFLIYLFWGSTYMAIRILVRELPPMAAAALRFGIAGLLMAGLAAIVHRREPRPTRRQLIDYALVGILLLSIGNAMVMWAERTIPSGIAALIGATVPLWLTFLDGLRPGGQPWTLRVWVGGLIGLVGVLLVARPGVDLTPGHWAGIGALQVASVAWTVGSLYAQAIRQRLPLFTAAAVEMLAASPLLVVQSRLIGEDWRPFLHASPSAWGAIAYLVAFGSLVGFTAFAYCLNELPASTVGTYAYVNPVVAVILGALFLGERLSPGLVAGGALIVVAVILTTRRPAKPVSAPADAARAAAEPSAAEPPGPRPLAVPQYKR